MTVNIPYINFVGPVLMARARERERDGDQLDADTHDECVVERSILTFTRNFLPWKELSNVTGKKDDIIF